MVTVHIGSAESWVHNVGQNQVRMVKFALCNGNFGSWTTHDLARYHDTLRSGSLKHVMIILSVMTLVVVTSHETFELVPVGGPNSQG